MKHEKNDLWFLCEKKNGTLSLMCSSYCAELKTIPIESTLSPFPSFQNITLNNSYIPYKYNKTIINEDIANAIIKYIYSPQ